MLPRSIGWQYDGLIGSGWSAAPEVRAHGGFSIGEQVLALGGELDTVFVLPVINYQEGLCGRFNRHSRDVQCDARVAIRV